MKSSAILCLQEVSYEWAAELHTFFANRGYHMVSGLYGKAFNGYMGVCLAWSTEQLETVGVTIDRLSDTRSEWPPADEEPNVIAKAWQGISKWMEKPMKAMGWEVEEVIDHWNMSKWRSNVLVTATLRDRSSGRAFCVGNYHMPCAYYAPRVMTMHADMAAARVQAVASDLPSVLAGDFNIKPSEPVYHFLTTGELDQTSSFFPIAKNGLEWSAASRPLRSAYAVASKEPDFTNYARVKDEDPFIDTLDYIFVSPEWKVGDTIQLVDREKSGGPFPNAVEPSDHLMIAVDLEA